jgi:hypothetical protein
MVVGARTWTKSNDRVGNIFATCDWDVALMWQTRRYFPWLVDQLTSALRARKVSFNSIWQFIFSLH